MGAGTGTMIPLLLYFCLRRMTLSGQHESFNSSRVQRTFKLIFPVPRSALYLRLSDLQAQIPCILDGALYDYLGASDSPRQRLPMVPVRNIHSSTASRDHRRMAAISFHSISLLYRC